MQKRLIEEEEEKKILKKYEGVDKLSEEFLTMIISDYEDSFIKNSQKLYKSQQESMCSDNAASFDSTI